MIKTVSGTNLTLFELCSIKQTHTKTIMAYFIVQKSKYILLICLVPKESNLLTIQEIPYNYSFLA